MEYEGNVYRPPSEARSLIVQATVGCSHNKCTFCNMYKDDRFKIKSYDEIRKDLDEMAGYYKEARRIFLADGDALIIKTEELSKIVKYCYEIFPHLERVGIYASAQSVLIKSDEELKNLKDSGIGIAYLGVETGSDKVLKYVNKGVNSADMSRAATRLKKSGITLSVMILLGLGGKSMSDEHVKGSVEIINKINPDFLSFLTLLIPEGTRLYEDVEKGLFIPNSPDDDVREIRDIINGLDVRGCIVRSNHASNYVSVRGVLNEDKEMILEKLNTFLEDREVFEKTIFYKKMTRGL